MISTDYPDNSIRYDISSMTTEAPLAVGLQPQPATDPGRVADIIVDAFATIPLLFAFLLEIDSDASYSPSAPPDRARRHAFYAPGIANLIGDGAITVQAGDWSSVAIWEPPGFVGRPFTNSGSAGPLRTEWRARVGAAKSKYLEDKPFWHLGFLARNPAMDSVPGAISALIRPYLDRARADGVPVWLEAIDERGVAIYEHFGFRLVEHVVVGKGTHSKSGWLEEGGEGVSGYCMIRMP